jgi:hypothetical protein
MQSSKLDFVLTFNFLPHHISGEFIKLNAVTKQSRRALFPPKLLFTFLEMALSYLSIKVTQVVQKKLQVLG